MRATLLLIVGLGLPVAVLLYVCTLILRRRRRDDARATDAVLDLGDPDEEDPNGTAPGVPE